MNFEDIRPYNDSEVKEKISSLLAEEQFQQIIKHVMPEIPFAMFERQMRGLTNVKDFQTKIIVPLLDKLLSKSTNGLSYQGIENLEKDKNYLFVSTHRDIVLDSALMDYALLKEGFDTVEIAIGDNLMKIPWIVDLVKLNKTFIVKRSLSKDQKAEGSKQLSSYIKHALKEKKQSIWIAHKAGRSKDGNDRTNPSLMKMFNMSGDSESIVENLKNLNICPVSISYEYNPCDILTMPELMAASKGERYEKQPMEDLIHMGQGLEGEKGKVEVSFGRPLNELLDEQEFSKVPNEICAKIASIIDKEIHQSYKLMPTNYIAFDILNGKNQFESEYSAEERNGFQTYMDSRLQDVEGDDAFKHETFLKMYAYPVINKLAYD